ncbi:MAG: shikimate dehydrogenase [Firmicutes bacterium]|nr:shikimate dehydrogenase [Bacillota bacterium]
MDISGTTRVIGLMGDPVLYSLSPAIQNAACRHLQLPYVYVAFRVEKAAVPAAVAAIRALDMVGMNVTVPHKEAVIPYLDELDISARRCGAVNTIVNREGRLTGYNTDGDGFLDALRELGFDPAGREAVILGAGGSARAVAAALLDSGIRKLTIINRTAGKAEQLAHALGSPEKITVLPLRPQASPDLSAAELVVNTLAIPFQSGGRWLLDLSSAAGALFYDLRYGGMPSAFLDYAWQLGSPGADGASMLLHQGARAFTLFTGRAAPLEVMRRALYDGSETGAAK